MVKTINTLFCTLYYGKYFFVSDWGLIQGKKNLFNSSESSETLSNSLDCERG